MLELGCSSVSRDASTKSWIQPPAPQKLDMVVHVRNLSPWELRQEDQEFKDILGLHRISGHPSIHESHTDNRGTGEVTQCVNAAALA